MTISIEDVIAAYSEESFQKKLKDVEGENIPTPQSSLVSTHSSRGREGLLEVSSGMVF